MPWNETPKPAQKPGPWDPPNSDDRGPGAPGEVSSAEQGRRRPRDGGRSPTPPAASPWSGPAAGPKPRQGRRPASSDAPQTSPPPRGPHLDELTRQLRARFSWVAQRSADRKMSRRLVAGAALAALLAWAASGTYVVEPDQTGLVTRFGALVAQAGPGLHYHLPAPIESVREVAAGALNRLDLGASSGNDASNLMLTRDGDLVDVDYAVQWRIRDPERYLFGLANPEASLKLAAQSALREAVARVALHDIVAAGRGGAPARATASMQAALDRDGAGIDVVGLQVSDVEPPEAAQGGYHEIADAHDQAQAALRDVRTYRDRVVAQARGDAAKMLQVSQGYRDEEVSEAKGEAERFALIDAQYRKAPQVTRDRLYTETMERVLHNTNKVIVQTEKGASPSIVLPSDLFRPKSGDSAAPTPSPPPNSSSTDGQTSSSTAKPAQDQESSGSATAPSEGPAA